MATNNSAPPTIPTWLRRLVAAYPTAKVTSDTLLVYEQAFIDTSPETMAAAIMTAIKQHRYASLPTVGEIEAIVDPIRVAELQPTSRRPADQLTTQRHTLLELGYRGQVDPKAWQQLITQLRQAGRDEAANGLAHKFTQFTGGQSCQSNATST